MWIALNDGFISVVTADPKRLPKADRKRLKGKGRPLCVRARKPEHLQRMFPLAKVYRWPGRDYPARVFIGAGEFATFMATRIGEIDYPNFKSSVADGELHDAYMGVWSVMNRYGFGGYKRRPYHPLEQREFGFAGVTSRERAARLGEWDFGSYIGERVRVKGDPSNSFFDDERERLNRALASAASDDDEVCGMLGCTPEHPCMDCLIDVLRDGETLDEPDRYGDFNEEDDDLAAGHLRVPPK